MEQKYPCPCCGFLTMGEEPPGTYEICPVCFWEDDPVQFKDPGYEGGANKESLNEARANSKLMGAISVKAKQFVRKPFDDEIPNGIK